MTMNNFLRHYTFFYRAGKNAVRWCECGMWAETKEEAAKRFLSALPSNFEWYLKEGGQER